VERRGFIFRRYRQELKQGDPMSFEGSTGLALVLLASVAVAEPRQSPVQPAKPVPPSAASLPAPADAPAATDNKVVTTEPLHVLILPMKGSYMQHPSAFERLGSYVAEHGISPQGPALARYFSDPSTPEADLAWEVGFPVGPTAKAEAPFELKDIPGGLHAVHVHKGSYEELATAWPTFVEWVMSRGYRPAGPPLQLFQGAFGSSTGIEMRMPVEK
jgi:effector-binding domain-containing protein